MSLTFMKNKYIDLSISFCYLVCLFLQNICLYFAQIFSNLTNTMDTIDNLLNYMDKTSTWIGVDILKNLNNYKFIFLASYTGTVMVNSAMIPKTIFKWFTSGTNFVQVGNSNVYFISDTRVNILSTSDAFRIYGIK